MVTRKPRDFRRIDVWHKSHGVVLDIYRITRGYPREEMFGLTSQSRRAAMSVPANIAEGCGRGTEPELARFMGNSMGSASELQYHLILARDLGYLAQDVSDPLIDRTQEVGRMLNGYIGTLQS